jgi:hypothetical protein
MANRLVRADHVPLLAALSVGWTEAADRFVNACTRDHSECYECSWICCPHQDPMHFHHDGCPSCAEDQPRPRCDGCHQEIDPDCCWCGAGGVPRGTL